jgi:hypothetical protein
MGYVYLYVEGSLELRRFKVICPVHTEEDILKICQTTPVFHMNPDDLGDDLIPEAVENIRDKLHKICISTLDYLPPGMVLITEDQHFSLEYPDE